MKSDKPKSLMAARQFAESALAVVEREFRDALSGKCDKGELCDSIDMYLFFVQEVDKWEWRELERTRIKAIQAAEEKVTT